MATIQIFLIIPSTQPSLECMASILSSDTSNDGQDTVKDTTTKKSTCKKSPVVLNFIKGVSEQVRRVFKQYDFSGYVKPMDILRQSLA